jgi:hypothetical protein
MSCICFPFNEIVAASELHAREFCVSAACWSLLHGMTMLSIDGLLLPEKVGVEPLIAAFGTLMEGIASA